MKITKQELMKMIEEAVDTALANSNKKSDDYIIHMEWMLDDDAEDRIAEVEDSMAPVDDIYAAERAEYDKVGEKIAKKYGINYIKLEYDNGIPMLIFTGSYDDLYNMRKQVKDIDEGKGNEDEAQFPIEKKPASFR